MRIPRRTENSVLHRQYLLNIQMTMYTWCDNCHSLWLLRDEWKTMHNVSFIQHSWPYEVLSRWATNWNSNTFTLAFTDWRICFDVLCDNRYLLTVCVSLLCDSLYRKHAYIFLLRLKEIILLLLFTTTYSIYIWKWIWKWILKCIRNCHEMNCHSRWIVTFERFYKVRMRMNITFIPLEWDMFAHECT